MTTDLDETGPIDYLVVEFPGSRMTGEGLPLLVDLVDSGIIRILDLVFVQRKVDGSVAAMEIADFDNDGELDLAVFEGASSGLLGQDDVEEAASVVEPGNSADQIASAKALLDDGTNTPAEYEQLKVKALA